MKLATVRVDKGHQVARIDGDIAVLLPYSSMSSLLREPDWQQLARAPGQTVPLNRSSLAPCIADPGKVICVGHNYRRHIQEMGRDVPDYPTLFSKFPSSLIGPYDDLALPRISVAVDWEVELAVVVGRRLYRASPAEAEHSIAGYSVMNDVSMRDWQRRTSQWLQGKSFDRSTPLGPYLVMREDVDPANLEVQCWVDQVLVQEANTSDLLFSPPMVISYVSQFLTLEPGDMIATGTPDGVGTSRTPPAYLQPGQVLRSRIQGIGECINTCLDEAEEFGIVRGHVDDDNFGTSFVST